MNAEDMLDILGGLPERVVENAARPERAAKRIRSQRALACAGALLLCIGVGAAMAAGRGAIRPQDESAVHGAVDTSTEGPHAAEGEVAMEYLGFIKYGGSVYWHTNVNTEAYSAGEYLGRVENVLTPGTPMDEWPDNSSYEEFDYYAVEGFDPDYLICAKLYGRTQYFVNPDGENANTPAEVLEGRYHASERIGSLVYEAGESVVYGYGELFMLDDARSPAVLDMLKAVGEGAFVRGGGAQKPENIEDTVLYRLTLGLSGTEMTLTLYRDGYALIQPLGGGSFIRYDEAGAEEFLALLRGNSHGTPVESREIMLALRPERLNSEPYFGAYFPKEPPEGFTVTEARVKSRCDENTGEKLPGRPECVSAEYRNADDGVFTIRVWGYDSEEELLESFEGIDAGRCDAPIDELSADRVYSVTNGGETFRDLSAYEGSILIKIHTDTLTPDEMTALLKECFGR